MFRAPAKQSQHLNTTDRNIVGLNMLHAFGHPVATCYDMSRVENWTNAHARRNVVGRTWPNDCNIMQHPQLLREKYDHFQIWANNTQHIATRRNMVAKRTQHVAPNNVAICCIEMLWSFGRGFIYVITKSMYALWVVNQLWFIVRVNSWKIHVSSELLFKSSRPQVSMVYRLINHLGCWKDTGRICKSLACGPWDVNSACVLPTSHVFISL